MSEQRTDLPSVNSPNFQSRIREVLMTYLGRQGNPLDRGVTLRDLIDNDIVAVREGATLRAGSGAVPIVPVAGSGSQAADLTPPPSPTGFVADAAITHVFVQHDIPIYAFGGGHLRTHLYGAKYSGSGTLPVFSDAVELAQFTGTIYVFPSDLSTQWHLWIKWETYYGVLSPSPAGGTNGVVVTTGKIGSADLGPLIVEASNLASGAVTASKLAIEAVGATNFAAGIEPVSMVGQLPNPVGYTGPKTVFLTTDSKLYRYTGSAWTTNVNVDDIDPRGLEIQDMQGNTVFGSDGQIGSGAYIDLNGNNVLLSDLASSQLTPSLNFVGTYASAPTQSQLGAQWLQNAVYRNTTDGFLYVLTGTPLGWLLYLQDGTSFVLTVESTNGTTFRPGQNQNTLLKARLFKNGAEVTDVTPEGWFRWRRVSAIPQSAPNDDATWNALYVTGYKQVSISVDSVFARATFFCDIISP